jgi:hypothetical protein
MTSIIIVTGYSPMEPEKLRHSPFFTSGYLEFWENREVLNASSKERNISFFMGFITQIKGFLVYGIW